jgi:hypothetical protein
MGERGTMADGGDLARVGTGKEERLMSAALALRGGG